MKYVHETLMAITKDWSDINLVYNDLKQCRKIVRSNIMNGKDYFDVYAVIVEQLALIEMEPDDFDGRVFRESVTKLQKEI